MATATLIRPEPTGLEMPTLVMPEMTYAFVTGGTRGVGRGVALELAEQGVDVGIGYNSDDEAAARVVAELQAANPAGIFKSFKGDITKADDRAEIVKGLRTWKDGQQLGGLILAASGGLERNRQSDTEYPMRINRTAQVGMIAGLGAAGLLDDASTTALLTSHQAWYLGRTLPDKDGAQWPIGAWESIDPRYKLIAETKKAGVDAVTEMAHTGELPGRLTIPSCDLIPDSDVAVAAGIRNGLMPKVSDEFPDKDSRRSEAGRLLGVKRQEEIRRLCGPNGRPLDDRLYTTREFGQAIARNVMDTTWTGVHLLLLPDHLEEMKANTFNQFG